MKSFVLTLIDLIWIALLVQIIISWLIVAGVRSPFVLRIYYALGQLLEPLMRPLRRVIPPFGTLDLTPLAAFILLLIARRIIERLL